MKEVVIRVRVKRVFWVKCWIYLIRLFAPILIRFFDADSILVIGVAGCKKIMKIELY